MKTTTPTTKRSVLTGALLRALLATLPASAFCACVSGGDELAPPAEPARVAEPNDPWGGAPPPTAYGPAYDRAPAADPYAPSRGPQTFAWYDDLHEAQSAARAQGKLVFIEVGRPACVNCKRLQNQVIPTPEVNAELASVAVGHYTDCDKDRNSRGYLLLYDSLPGANVLPLAGFVTADLEFVHGFYGNRDVPAFRRDIEAARVVQTRLAVRRPAQPADRRTTGSPARGSGSAQPDADADAEIELAAPETAMAGLALPSERTAPQPDAGDALPARDRAAMPPPTPPGGLEARRVGAPAPVDECMDAESLKTWARGQLRRAATAVSDRDYTLARSILGSVEARMRGLPEAREAQKGEVAIYNQRLIDAAGEGSAEATKIRTQAQAQLRDTVWADLFG